MARARPARRKSPRRLARSGGGRGAGVLRSLAPVLIAALILGGLAWIFRANLFPGPPSATPASRTAIAATPVSPISPPRPPPPTVPSPAEPAPAVAFSPPPPIPESTGYPRVVANLLEAQVALARLNISSGAIDGVAGAQSAAALAAFQQSRELPPTGQLDPATRARLVLATPALETVILETADLAGLQPIAPTWLGKSEQDALAHETLLERLAERTQAHPNFLRRINPKIVWENLAPGAAVLAPSVRRDPPAAPVAHLHVRLAERILQARDAQGGLVAHFPVSIAKRVDKRPVGSLKVVVVVPDPNYTFDPAVFPESAEAAQLGRKLILPPGPNNPVGVAWIGLDRAGYGIHGTPTPEQVGRTESHGCFRLANWDARALLTLARPGLPVFVEP